MIKLASAVMKLRDVPIGSKIKYAGVEAWAVGCVHRTYPSQYLIGWKLGEDSGSMGWEKMSGLADGNEAQLTKLDLRYGWWVDNETEVEVITSASHFYGSTPEITDSPCRVCGKNCTPGDKACWWCGSNSPC